MKKSGVAPMPGGSSLLVIFSVLCLTVFALLTLTTVQAEQRLSQRAARSVTDYYAADLQAQTILARLREESAHGEGEEVTYTCPISEDQELLVRVYLEGGDYEILCWQSRNIEDWQEDTTLDVWDGN